MKKWIASSIILLLIAGLVGANQIGLFAPSFSSVAHNPIQRVELTDLRGGSHSFDELEGKDSVIYFFASWCLPCYKTLATLQEISQKQELKFNLLTVALDGDQEGIAEMLDRTGFTGAVWIATEGIWALQKRYFGNERRAVPYVVVLDKETNISESGYEMDSAQWEAVLVDGLSLAKARDL